MANVDEQKRQKYRDSVSASTTARGSGLLFCLLIRLGSRDCFRFNDDTVASFNFLIREDNGFRARAPEIKPQNQELQTLPANLEGFRRKRPGPTYTALYLQAMAYLIAQNCGQVASSKFEVSWGEVEYQLKCRGFNVASEEALASKA